ncbi:MAG: hypothetical protein A2648_00845 [Candidatus Lloydbacteria bacterium RIFCSPHIGHO2_01_FULL_41_20]|uniref:Glycerophosphoryl diester phosphodiesterase membrane domain-containing protein n=1 Tax=Candidatus Lloydbacteria bacterium RIFCSPHIGHO2_01_FULL_41_20 TaxID=1798657 RepID=A0A1G2CV73_9BACT|nr:MAG: hypothetical protein A2648_00845 [Candidatus Lloydbacteria bacterium RIFCSPHIGHO2_01_FULL_41_20]
MDTLFSKKELLQMGWNKTKEYFWFLFGMLVLVLLVTGASNIHPIVTVIVGVFVSISIITTSLTIADGGTPSFKGLFSKYGNYKIFVNYIIASIATGVVVIVGLILLVIPGIYLAIRLQFYKFLIVDKGDIGPIESLKESWKMTKGYAWNLFLFLILIALLNILGVILFGVGLFVTIPISLLSYAILYRKLHARLIPTKTA